MRTRSLKIAALIITLLLLGVAGGVGWQKVSPTPSPPPPLPPITSTLPQPSRPEYVLKASPPPAANLPLYRWEPRSLGDSQERARQWAKTLGFGEEPEELSDALLGTLYLWTKNGQTLLVDQKASTLSFGVDLFSERSVLAGSFLPSAEAAAAIVERTLLDLSPKSALLRFDPQKSRALKVSRTALESETPDKADLVEVHFTAKVGELPLYLKEGPGVDPVAAWVGKDGKILRLEYHPLGVLGEKIGEYPLKNAKEIEESLKKGEGVWVRSTLGSEQKVTTVLISEAALGYLRPSGEATALFPVLVLSGQARTAEGTVGEITIYLSALR